MGTDLFGAPGASLKGFFFSIRSPILQKLTSAAIQVFHILSTKFKLLAPVFLVLVSVEMSLTISPPQREMRDLCWLQRFVRGSCIRAAPCAAWHAVPPPAQHAAYLGAPENDLFQWVWGQLFRLEQ